MATTTNYGWTTPDDTALVKDGAAAIRSLGTAIDTTTYNNAQAAIAKTLIDAKGDLIVGSASDTAARLAVGTNNHVLTADSNATNGVKWAAPSSGALTKITSGTFTSVPNFSIDSVFSATYANYKIILVGTNGGGTATNINVRFSTSGTVNTDNNYSGARFSAVYADGTSEIDYKNNQSSAVMGHTASTGGFWLSFDCLNPYLTQQTAMIGGHTSTTKGGASAGRFNATTSFDGINFQNQAGQDMTGSYIIYGYEA